MGRDTQSSKVTNRRRLLASLGVSFASGLAGCNSNDGTDNTTNENGDQSTTAGDSTSTTSTTTADELRFNGGTLSDFVAALRTADQQDLSKLKVEPGTYRFDPISNVEPGSKDRTRRSKISTISSLRDLTQRSYLPPRLVPDSGLLVGRTSHSRA